MRILFGGTLLVVMLLVSAITWGQNVSATWGSAAGTAWYTGGNWVGGSYPGVQGAAASNSNIATFTSVGTGNPIGINMGTNSLNLGAISVDNTRTTAENISNSSATSGILRLYGATVNSVPNTIIRNNGTGLLSFQTTANTLNIGLGNNTENIINIQNLGGITINSVISDVAAGAKLTKTGVGVGVLQLTGANTYTGLTTVNGGTLQLNRTGGTTIPSTNSVVVEAGGTLLISTAQTLNNVTVNPLGNLIIAAGLTVTGTFTVNGNLWINSGGFVNTAPTYGSSSLLKYNSGGTYGRGIEWSATSGAGYPANVEVSNNTTLNLGNGGTGTARQCSGGLAVIAGSTLSMNVAGSVMTAPLTVLGYVNLSGTLTLSSASGGDIKVGGDWLFNAGGTFNSNSRAVFFIGSALQTITRSPGGTLNFDYLVNQSSGFGLRLTTGTNVNVNGSGNGLQMAGTGTGNRLDLYGNILQLGTGTNLQLTGAQIINSAVGTGIVRVQSGGSNNVNSGTGLTLSSAVDVQLNGGMNFGSGLTTLNGTLTINSGGFVNSNAPTYGSASTLKYNSGGNYGRASEWTTTSGAGYPANVQISNNTTLDPVNGGSLASVPLQLSGNLTIDNGSSLYMDFGGNNMTVPLIINGSLSLQGNLSASGAVGGDVKVRGDWTRTGAGAFFPNSRAVFFDGATGTQNIGSSSFLTFDYLVVDKAAGDVSLGTVVTVNQTATLTNAVITTNSYKLIIASGGSISRVNGHVAGNLQKAVAAGSPTVNFEIGDASNYRPVTVAFNGVSTGGNLTAGVSQTAGAHFNLPTSTINNTLRLDRYFTLTNAGIAFTSYDATFNYVAADVINGANPLNFIAGKWNGSSWTYPTVGTKTSTSTQITGETAFSDFAFGELNATPTLTAGTLAGFGNVCVNSTSAANTFTITGNTLSAADVTVAALSGFSYSTDDITYTSSLSIPQPGGAFSQLIYVKFNPTLAQSYDGNIVVGGGGATNINVAATGSGINTPATVTTTTASGLSATGATVPGTITSEGCSAISAYGVEYSTTLGFANGSGTQAPGSNLSAGSFSVSITGLTPSTTYYYHALATNGGGTAYSSEGSFTTLTPTLSGSALTAFGNVCTGVTAGPNTFTITGTNLTTADVTVASLNGFSYSTDDITYSASLTLPQPGGNFSQLVYVKFNPALVQSYDGNIVIGGAGAGSSNVAASGSGVNTVPSVATGASSGVTQVAATLAGSISADGCTAVTDYGVEYSTTNGFANGTGTAVPGSNLSAGAFSVAVSGLSANTTYYYHAYATNGGGTGYGAQQSFTTAGLDAPVATAATDIAATSFTANWNAVTGATSYALDVATTNDFITNTTLASEAFENAFTLFTGTGGAFYNNNSAAGDRPANVPFAAAGSYGFGISNGTVTITSSNINTAASSTSQLSFRLSSFSIGSTGNGADGGDIVTVEISPNGGTRYFSTLRVLGNGNAYWDYSSGTGTASTAYDGNATPADFAPAGGGARTGDGYSTITITNLPAVSNLRVRITLLNNSANERWVIDALQVSGSSGSFVPGYNNLPVTGTSQSVTGLTPNTTYYYRVRGVSASSTSANSNTITAQTCQTATLGTTQTDVSCNGGTNGSIDLTITGGTAPIAISWTGPNGFTATSEDISGLAAGQYDVTVTSNTGCPATTSVTITEPAALSATLSGTPIICEGESTNITVTIAGGTAPYSITYNDGAGNTTVGSLVLGANSIPVNPAGTTSYTLVSATDAGTCTGSVSGAATVTVNPNYTITASAGANGSIAPNGITTLSCDGTGDQTFTITADPCYTIADVIVDGSSVGPVGTYTFTDVNANHTISASFVLITYTITVTPGANGNISPATGSVNCGEDATYTITADACYSISDVIVDGISQGPVTTYTFNDVAANHTISASFVQDTYTITVTAGANGSITPATGSVNCGDDATYTITADPCYAIVDVIVDGSSVGPVGSYTFNDVAANHTISATFALNTYTITVTPGANGTILPASGSVNCGDDATYTIVANVCYVIDDVIVDGVSQGPVGAYTFNDVSANHTISATFVLNTYTITVTAGANGSITPGTGSVNCGDNATYTITPDAGYGIQDVIVDGVSQGPVTSYTFNNVMANHSISATFVINATYTITATAGPNGSIAPNGATVVNSGGSQSYTITPNACYHVLDVLVDGSSVGPVTTYNFTNVTANHTISATFALNAALLAPVVTGPVNVCQYINTGDPVVYTFNSAGATAYSYVLPPNVSLVGSTANSITLNFLTGFDLQANKQIRVTALSPCGNSPMSIYYLAAQKPVTPQPITASSSNICAVIGTAGTITYTINKVVGATSYVWTNPAGTTIAHPNGPGINDTTVTLSFSNAFTNSNLTVQAANGCGTSNARSFTITRSNPSTPALITGPTNVCQHILPGGTAAVYKVNMVANATSYNWTVTPNTAVVTHPNGPGAMDTVINVTFQAGFTTGTITVSASNGCGTGGVRSLTLSKLNPSTPGVIDVINTVPCPNRAYSYTIASVPSNATSLVWTIPAGGTIVSQSPAGPLPTSITVSYPTTAITGNVTVQALNNCGSSTVRVNAVTLAACPEDRGMFTKGTVTPVPAQPLQVTVFPNPTVSDFKVQVATAGRETVKLRILDMQGREIRILTVMPYQTTGFGADLKAGSYILEARQGNKMKTLKLLKF